MSEKKTVIESGTEFEGVLRSQWPVLVDGQLTGEVFAPTLTLTDAGSVRGKVTVKQLTSHGSLGGEINAESVELSGRVDDNTVIHSTTLVTVDESEETSHQVAFGNCELHVGDPAKTANGASDGNKDRAVHEPVAVN
jgi:cytoskeletal protein CcmA (bactofilin family)